MEEIQDKIPNDVPEVESSTIIIDEDQWSLLLEQSENEKLLNEQTVEQISILNENINSLNDMVGNSVSTGITYEQAEMIISNLDLIIKGGKYGLAAVFGYFLFKFAYNLISSFFSGL